VTLSCSAVDTLRSVISKQVACLITKLLTDVTVGFLLGLLFETYTVLGETVE